MVINPQFDSAGDFHDGRAVAKLGDKLATSINPAQGR